MKITHQYLLIIHACERPILVSQAGPSTTVPSVFPKTFSDDFSGEPKGIIHVSAIRAVHITLCWSQRTNERKRVHPKLTKGLFPTAPVRQPTVHEAGDLPSCSLKAREFCKTKTRTEIDTVATGAVIRLRVRRRWSGYR